MQRTLILILLFFPVGTGHAGAQTTVTEEAFLAAVDDAHPASRALTGELGAAEADLRRAELLSEPRLEITREELNDVEYEVISGVAWTPPIDGRRRWDIRASEAGIEVEKSLLEWRLAEQRRDLRRTYAAWAGAGARVSVLVEHSNRLERLAERMRNRAEAGEESLLDAQRLEIAFKSSQVALSRARATSAAARAQAAGWLVGDPTDLSPMQPEMPDLQVMPNDLDSAARPDFRAARSRMEQTEAQLRLSRHVVAAPELLLGWKKLEGALNDFDGPVLGLTWEIPIFNRRRADRMAAENAAAVADAGYEWTRRRAQADLAASMAAYDELRRSALSARGTLENLDDMARAATGLYEQGESTVTDLLDTLRALLNARLAALEQHIAALEAHRELEFAAGRPLISGDLS